MSTCIVILLLWYIYKYIYKIIKEEQCFPTSYFIFKSNCASFSVILHQPMFTMMLMFLAWLQDLNMDTTWFEKSNVFLWWFQAAVCVEPQRQVVGTLSCGDSAVALRPPNRDKHCPGSCSFYPWCYSFWECAALLRWRYPFGICKSLTVHLPAGAWPSPLEVAHRLNYTPYLQSVCKHLLSSHTTPPSTKRTPAPHPRSDESCWGTGQ